MPTPVTQSIYRRTVNDRPVYDLRPDFNPGSDVTKVTDLNEVSSHIAYLRSLGAYTPGSPTGVQFDASGQADAFQDILNRYNASRDSGMVVDNGNLTTQQAINAAPNIPFNLGGTAPANPLAPQSNAMVLPSQNNYQVPQGGNLTMAAQAMGISLQQLLEANPEYKANPNFVRAGAFLKYPQQAGQTPQNYDRFQQGHQAATNAGIQPPSNYEGANSMFNQFLPSQQQPDQISNFISQDPYLQSTLSAFQQYMSPQNQRTSLVDTYKSMLQESGIQGIDTDLINMKKVIEGTEDDIRTEVTKAGGFATDSQVMALANARNKQLIKNYNTLLETRNSKAQYLDTMMNLTQQDRQAADQKFETMTNFGFKMSEINQQMKQSAISTLDRAAQTIGWDGIYNATQGNPQLVAQIERTYGLPPGGLVMAVEREKTATKPTGTARTAGQQGANVTYQRIIQGAGNIYDLTPAERKKVEDQLFSDGFYDQKPPSWFVKQVEQQFQQSLVPAKTKELWEQYRQGILATAKKQKASSSNANGLDFENL